MLVNESVGSVINYSINIELCLQLRLQHGTAYNIFVGNLINLFATQSHHLFVLWCTLAYRFATQQHPLRCIWGGCMWHVKPHVEGP